MTSLDDSRNRNTRKKAITSLDERRNKNTRKKAIKRRSTYLVKTIVRLVSASNKCKREMKTSIENWTA